MGEIFKRIRHRILVVHPNRNIFFVCLTKTKWLHFLGLLNGHMGPPQLSLYGPLFPICLYFSHIYMHV